MPLLYLSDAEIPSRSSNSMQVMRMCSALGAIGVATTLVRPRTSAERPEGLRESIWKFYGVEPTFDILTLSAVAAPDSGPGRVISRAARGASFAALLGRRSRAGAHPFVCYGRSRLGVLTAIWARRAWGARSACRAVALELHDVPRAVELLRRVDIAITISEALRARIIQVVPDLDGRTWVEHDGVDLARIGAVPNQALARSEVNLPPDIPLVVYAGRAMRGKGVDVLLAAAGHLRDLPARVVVVGKVYEPEYLRLGQGLGNVTFTGFVPPAQVPLYLSAADVLVMPTTPDLPFAAYTSPLKLFEYMAAGRPVAASDLAVLREVLHHRENALLYEPTDGFALAAAVRELLRDQELAGRLSAQALRDVRAYSWEERARRIAERLAVAAGSS
jgi:glycosyltransferase involved in cell wall biosynthesis